MTLVAFKTVRSYLEQDQKKLRDVSNTGLTDAVRWEARLLGAFTVLEPNMGLNAGHTGRSPNIVNN